MTTPPPFDYSIPLPTSSPRSLPPPPLSTSGLLIRVICWTIILLLSGLEVVANIARDDAKAHPTSQSATRASTTETAAINPTSAAIEPSTNITLAACGRYVVAARSWAKQDSSALKILIDQLQRSAKTIPDQIDVAILSREVEPPDDAKFKFAKLAAAKDRDHAEAADLHALAQIEQQGPDSLSPSQRQSLIARHGWFGQLALIYRLPNDNPARTALIAGTHHVLIVFGVGATLLAIALIAGCILMVTAIIFGATGKLTMRYRRPYPPSSAYLEAFTIYMAGFLLFSLAVRALVETPSLGMTFFAIILLPVVLVWPIIRGESWDDVKEQYGWHRGRGILIEMGVGIVTYLAFLPLFAIAFMITLMLIKVAETLHITGATPTHPIVSYLTGSPGTIVLVFLLASVFAPLMEETMFRGALFNHLRGRHGWWLSSIIVSLIFAAIHPQGWTVIPPLAALAMAFCAMREWRGSLIGSMTAHALNNGVVLAISILMLR